MAAIFQIRRGGSSYTSSLVSGELYLNTAESAFQVGTSGNPIKLLSLNTASFGDIILTGSAYISGNVVLGGTITIGDSTSDSVIFNADLSSSIIPDATNTYDLGATNKVYRNLYATSISGAIAATNGVISGSSQIVSILVPLNSFSASVTSSLEKLYQTTSSLNLFSASVTSSLVSIYQTTASLNLFSASVTSSLEKIYQTTASLNTFTESTNTRLTNLETTSGSHNGRLTNLESKSASVDTSLTQIHLYTSSLKTAIGVSGTNVTVLGNLTVNGTTTQIDSTTLNIGDNIIELNYGGSQTASGIIVKDATGGSTTSGSLLWDSTNDYWKGGTLANESKVLLAGGDSVLSSSIQLTDLNSFTSSTNNRLTNLESTTSSLNISVSNINTTTASLNTSVSNINIFTGSANGRLTNLESKSASVDVSITNINNTTASLNTSVTNINSFTGSQLTQNSNLATISGSLISSASTAKITNDTQDGRLTNLETKSSSVDISITALNSYTTSISTSFGQFSSSYNVDSASFDYRINILDPGNIGDSILAINATTASLNTSVTNINLTTASLNTSVSNLNAATSSYETNGRGIISGSSQITLNLPTGVVSGSEQVNIYDVENYATFNDAIQGDIGEKLFTSSFNEYTASQSTGSLVTSISNLNTATSSYETKGRGIFSGSSQVDGTAITNKSITIAGTSVSLGGSITAAVILGGTNVVSGSLQILGGSGVFSGSSQVDADSITNFDSNVKAKLDAETVVSGSSQINLGSATGNITLATQTTGNYVASLVQGTGVTITNNSGENSTPTITIGQAVGTSSNVQFNSIGIGTAASGADGEVRATGDITAYYSSDIRLKENIVPIENALEKVESISGNTYDWKVGYEEIHSHKGNDVGVIAQEIEEILPQIVTNRDNGYKAVQYEKIIPLLVEAIKELSAKIKRLENK